jgi:hypothetical protein
MDARFSQRILFGNPGLLPHTLRMLMERASASSAASSKY